MFSLHATESDWEWARKRRRIFTNPLKDALSGFALGVLGGWYRYAAGDSNWRIAVVVSVITVAMAFVLPHSRPLGSGCDVTRFSSKN